VIKQLLHRHSLWSRKAHVALRHVQGHATAAAVPYDREMGEMRYVLEATARDVVQSVLDAQERLVRTIGAEDAQT
jgi:hypothetical protein